MKSSWWKILAVALVFYTIVAGFLVEVPRLATLHETIRNLFFHVTMWFGMIILLLVSLVYSIRYLLSSKLVDDLVAEEMAKTGILFGLLGLLTGSIWAKFTWSEWPLFSLQGWWVNDAKLNGAAATMLLYLAFLLLRGSIDDEHKRARVSAVYSIFAYPLMLVFIMVMPRLTDSLHPGNGGNPGFGNYDLDNTMRLIFYPAVIGWTLMGVWISTLRIRLKKITLHD